MPLNEPEKILIRALIQTAKKVQFEISNRYIHSTRFYYPGLGSVLFNLVYAKAHGASGSQLATSFVVGMVGSTAAKSWGGRL